MIPRQRMYPAHGDDDRAMNPRPRDENASGIHRYLPIKSSLNIFGETRLESEGYHKGFSRVVGATVE